MMLFLVGFEPKETLESSQDTAKAAQQNPVSALTNSPLQHATTAQNASQLSKAADSGPVIQDNLHTTAQAVVTSSGHAAEQPLPRAQQAADQPLSGTQQPGLALPSDSNSHSTLNDQPSTPTTATAAEQQREGVAVRQPVSATPGAAINAAARHFAAKGPAAVVGKRAGAALAAPEMSSGPWSIKAGAVEPLATEERSQEGMSASNDHNNDNHNKNPNNNDNNNLTADWPCPFIAYLPWP